MLNSILSFHLILHPYYFRHPVMVKLLNLSSMSFYARFSELSFIENKFPSCSRRISGTRLTTQHNSPLTAASSASALAAKRKSSSNASSSSSSSMKSSPTTQQRKWVDTLPLEFQADLCVGPIMTSTSASHAVINSSRLQEIRSDLTKTNKNSADSVAPCSKTSSSLSTLEATTTNNNDSVSPPLKASVSSFSAASGIINRMDNTFADKIKRLEDEICSLQSQNSKLQLECKQLQDLVDEKSQEIFSQTSSSSFSSFPAGSKDLWSARLDERRTFLLKCRVAQLYRQNSSLESAKSSQQSQVDLIEEDLVRVRDGLRRMLNVSETSVGVMNSCYYLLLTCLTPHTSQPIQNKEYPPKIYSKYLPLWNRFIEK